MRLCRWHGMADRLVGRRPKITTHTISRLHKAHNRNPLATVQIWSWWSTHTYSGDTKWWWEFNCSIRSHFNTDYEIEISFTVLRGSEKERERERYASRGSHVNEHQIHPTWRPWRTQCRLHNLYTSGLDMYLLYQRAETSSMWNSLFVFLFFYCFSTYLIWPFAKTAICWVCCVCGCVCVNEKSFAPKSFCVDGSHVGWRDGRSKKMRKKQKFNQSILV